MRTILLCIVVAVGNTTASDHRAQSHEDESSRTKRLLLDSTQQTQIRNGFDAATHLFDKMDKLDFGGAMGDVVGSVTSFLGAVGPFVGLVLSLFSGPSAEYQLLKRLFTQVENRFDQVDVQFAALRRQVAFVATQVHFTDLESNINAVHSELKTLSEVTNSAGYRSESHEFVRTFDRTYESSGIKLYNSIMHGGALTGGLFYEFMTHSTYDRKQTQHFMLGTLNLLMRASALEMTYAQLKHDPNIAIKRRDWISRFTQLKNKMTEIDNTVVKNYHTQMVSDINTFAAQHPKGSLSNTAFADQLYSKLATKVIMTCMRDRKSWKFGQIRPPTAELAVIERLKKKIRQPISHTIRRYGCKYSDGAWADFPASIKNQCNTYTAAGVVCMMRTDMHLRGAHGRYMRYNPHGANLAFTFG